jgi:hypothetical protein
VKKARWAVLAVIFVLIPFILVGQERPIIVVHAFSAAAGVPWPYDMAQLRTQAIAEMKAKLAKHYGVVVEAPSSIGAHVYTLDGEILQWHAGNRAERMLVGAGTGREWADIHFWVTNETGKKVFDHTDTIKAEFWGNAYAGSVGQLSHPLADKISHRLADARLN